MMKIMIYNKMELNRENIKAFGHTMLHFLSPSGSLPTDEGGRRGYCRILSFLLLLFFSFATANAQDPWDGSVASKFASGTGTKADPYIISNAAELAYFGTQYNGSSSYYKITADIDLGGREWGYHEGKTFNGHLIGDKGNGAKPVISNYEIIVPNNDRCYGLLGTVSSGEIRNIGVSTVSVTFGVNISNSVKVGSFIGNVESGSLVEDCSAENITVNSGSASASTSYCSGFIGRIGNGYSVVRNCSVKVCTFTISGSIDKGGNYATLVGRMDNGSLVEGCSTEDITITANYSLTGPNLSGLVGSMYGSSSSRAVITKCSVKNVTMNIGGNLGKMAVGGIVGWAGKDGNAFGYADITRCKTTGLKIYFSGKLNASAVTADIRIGGMVGKLEKDCKVTDCLLYESSEYGKNYIGSNPNVNVNNTFCRNICMYVGGVVGSTVDQGSTNAANQIVIERCVAYCDFDFTGYKSVETGNLSKNNFVIGGVIGRLYNPYYIPTTLYYSGKVKAPYCVVGPLVGTFLKSKDSNDFIYNDYSGVNNTRANAADYSKWYYDDYQLWLTSSVINSGKTMNGSYTTEGYATIGDVSGWTENRIGSALKASKTILPYSSNGSNADMSIYPAYTASSGFPDYYMYYAQGVNRGSYQSNFNTVLAALRDAEDGPFWDVDANGKIVMYEFVATEKMKATDAFKSILTIHNDDGSALPSGYTYEWKVDGTTIGTDSSIEMERGMEAKTATVHISNGGSPIGECTVTIPRKEWYDYGSMASAPTNGNGTAENPYQIATASDLAWMGYHVSEVDAENTEHYVLTADIDLGNAWWSPMNGMEETGVGAFAGVFDGQGYTISNLHIDWNANYAAAANFGLFSIIKGTAAQWAVVKNLVIADAVASKEASDNILGNRCVGILAGNVKEYSQIENVIVRNSEMKASATASAQNGKELYFGGLVGKINSSSNNYSFLNISTDVEINLSGITVNTASKIAVGGLVGQWQANAKTCVKNVYALGDITIPSGLTNVGSVFGQNYGGLTDAVKATIFYLNAARQNVGTQKELADYATTFLATANETVWAREDLYPWVYSMTPGYGLSHLKMVVVDNNDGLPRLDLHTLEIKGRELDEYTFRWYLNDEEIGSGTTCSVRPSIPSNNLSLHIDVQKNGSTVATLSAAVPMLIFAGSGTSADDPYLIGHKEELLLLSYLSNQSASYEYYGKTTADYNQAYYLLDADVDLTGVTDFTPIGSVKDNYQAENCFRGHFDGKGLSITGMNILWKAGDVNAEVNRVWGLFGAVQGVSGTQKAIIQNLVIKNAVLTHDTGNTSFYYNGTSGTANNCYVGVLAGVVGANATIQNIEVSNCSITDNGSTQYGVAKHMLSVGGVIGRSQYSFASDAGDMNTTTTIRLLVSDCDITINSAKFENGATSADQCKVDVAGIIGSMMSSGASATMPWPDYTYYTGKVKAIGKAMVSPLFSVGAFRNNTRSDYDYYCNLYVGKINAAESDPVSNIFYDNRFKIYYDGAYRDITDSYPAISDNNAQRNPCDMGARTILSHSYYDTKWHHQKDLQDYYYQGVNYGAYVDLMDASAMSAVASAFSTGRSEATFNDEIKAFGFTFGADGKLHLGEVFDITFTDDNLGDASKFVHTLTVTNKLGDEGLTYKWYVNGEEKPYSNSEEIRLGVTPQLVYVKVFRGSDLKYTTEVIELPRGYIFSADYSPKYDFSGSFTVTPDNYFTEGGYTYSYDWQEWSDGTTTNLHYTAQQCFDANRSYIESVTQGSTPVLEANWSADIYANPSNYTVTYKHIMTDVISAEEYAALSAGEQADYMSLGDGTYGKDSGITYTPISTNDTYTSSSSGKIPLSGGETVSGATLSGANENKTYYCTVTATDAQWNTFVANHGTEDIFKDLIAKYETSFTTELTVKYIKSIIVYLHTKDTETINGVSYPSGNDENDGKTDQTPVRTWQKAYSLLKENAPWDENYIVLIGTSSREATCDQTGGNKGFSITSSLQGNAVSETYVQWKAKVDASHLAKNATITGMWEGVDYGGIIEAYEDGNNGVKYIGLFGDTRFQNITFNHDSRAKHSSYIFCQYNSLEMGEGVQMTGFTSNAPGYGTIDGAKTSSFQIYGGLNNDKRFRTDKGVLDMAAMEAAMPHGKEGFTITLKSGHYSCITPAGRQSTSNQINGLMGTPNMPIKCTVTIDIDRAYNDAHNQFGADYDCGIIAASHEGPMYADLDIVIKSGYVARVVNGHMGNQKNFNFDYNGKNYRFPDNTYSGRANILVDPRDGDNSKVIITELYGGSTGRGFTGGITIKNPFYGYSTVTINGGTFTILPKNNPKKNMIFSGIFGAGAGGYNGVGDDENPTVDEHIAYWNSDSTVVLYGPYADAKGKFVSVKCYNPNDPTNPYTMVDPAKTNTNIVINGGIFGSSTQPIDGIYAGGSGFMSPSLFNDRGVVPSKYGGNIYGKAGETVSTLTITGGTFYCDHGIFAGGRGTDKFYSEDAYAGTPSDYTELGKTYGNVVLNINGGTMYCNVYGGGAGVAEALLKNTTTYGTLTNMARLTGNTFVNIGGTAKILSYNGVGGNVYGGGMLAAVDGTTTVNISGNAEIEGNVFGAAQGITNDVSITTIPHTLTPYLLHTPENATLFGIVNGNTVVKTSGNPSVNGDIYGGAESAITNGSTSITLNGCTLNGNIYGGGLGALTGGTSATTATDAQVTASADIKGTTYIKVDKVDYASSSNDYYLYGGGNMASKVEGKTEIIVNDCTTKGQMSVYGGGYGTMAPVSDTYTTINDFTTKEGDYGLATIFGGGNAGPVSGGATVTLNGGQVFGDVFGGGNVASVGTVYPADGSDEEKEDYIRHYPALYGTEISMQGVGPVVYGNIYGGGNKADIYGNAVVNISKGAFAGEIFGGGNGDITTNPISFANVIGSTSVYIDGATVVWNRKWNRTLKRFYDWNGEWGGENWDEFLAGEESAPIFINSHNIYGGGNRACRVMPIADTETGGLASVEVTKGFCGYELLSTEAWKNAYNDSKNPHFYVFGGGYGAYTSVAETKVYVAVSEQQSEGATTDMQLAKATNHTLEPEDGSYRKKAKRNGGTDNASIGVYDDSYGVAGNTVLGVLGGGYAGLVIGDTDVKVGGNTYMHRVYGGGYGQLDAYTMLQQGTEIYDGKTRDNLGEVGGNATVLTDGGYIYGDVFGGGAGVESAIVNGTLTDFKDMARVHGMTSVTISGKTQVFGSVYGGGDVANVGEENTSATAEPESRTIFDVEDMFLPPRRYEHANAQSFVNVIGGDIFGEVFAGGNGRRKSEASDYTTLGRVEGNTLVHVGDSTLADGSTIVPTVWNRIFGGCSYGTVNGSTFVHIEGGKLGHNIFGGGLGDAADDAPEAQTNGTYADIKGNTTVKIDGGKWLWNQLADNQGNIVVWKDATQVVANNLSELRTMSAAKFIGLLKKYADSRFFNIDASGKCSFVIAHNIFGGGKDACNVVGKAKVTINHSPIARLTDDEGNSINLLDETTVGGLCWYASISNINNPQFSVFGGGWGINTRVGETDVYVGPGARFDYTGAKLVLKPYDDDVEGTSLKYDGTNEANNDKFYFTIAPGDLGKEPYAYINDDISEYVIFENALLDDFNAVGPEERIRLYGSFDGGNSDTHTFLRYRASRLAMSLGVPTCTFMDIHGGGFSGYVTGNTKVVTDCELACRNVFGGGLGSLPTNPTGNETYGEVGGNTSVILHSGFVSLNVFGGGAGVESYKDGDTFIDFPDIARVKGKTHVEVWGEAMPMTSDIPNPDGEGYQTYDKERVLVFGNVYGGGDVANVGTVKTETCEEITLDNQDSKEFTTSVCIYGGGVFSSVFAGGNGRTKNMCNDYTKLGAVYGNTRFCVENTVRKYPYVNDDELDKPVIPYIWNRIYGGCQNGTVYGNTFMDFNGGYIVYNMFGGGWGNVDSLTVNGVKIVNPDGITSADVTGNTNIIVRNAEAKVNSLWDSKNRTWTEAHVVSKNGEQRIYSPQYDPDLKKFNVNHNIYGGGNVACKVGGNTYVTMTKGLIPKSLQAVSGVSTDDIGGFFNTNEWMEIYHKVGSPHFCVFGGGYGENTLIENNTNVNVSLEKEEMLIKDADELHDNSQLHAHFLSRQSVMDVVGGGYSGPVRGVTNVTIGGETFLRRAFGGGFYAPVGAAEVTINSVDCRDIFGGGLMGDVGFTDESMYNDYLAANPDKKGIVTLNIGPNGNTGESLYVHDNVYGGNDVSGDILNKTILNISAGHVLGNVYGAGNGDYLYAVGRNGEKKVTVNEYYKMGRNTYDLVYTVPLRSFMTSIAASSPAQRMVNCSSYRPKVQNVEINLSGPSADNRLELGGVYGGGNSATVNNLNGNKPVVTFHFGSNLNIKNVFMGCDGDAMFDGSEKYRKAYEDLNSLHLEDAIDWSHIPGNHAITMQYLPVSHENRPKVYQHLLDLYFQSVEMDVQPIVYWADDMQNVTIGSFYCGGNRGNMNVEPDENGNMVTYTFPSSLVITDKIVGGCNMANYRMPYSGILHKGGYLLGARGKDAIKLNVECQFLPYVGENGVMEGANVYGGCYTSGTIVGDVHIDMKSDMLANITPAELAKTKEKNLAVCSIYGAGYGSLAYVRGNTHVDFGKDVAKNRFATATRYDTEAHGATTNYIYGGGQQGNVVGNSYVRIYNGHVASSVCGGSYSGIMWGSTHVLVGYPKYYTVQKSGTYHLQRTDKWNAEVKNEDGSEMVKKTINLLEGDIISEEVFDAIHSYDAGHTQATMGEYGNFSNIVTTSSGVNWNSIDIKIDEAVYGGGYALASGSSVAAGTYTVKKFDGVESLGEEDSGEWKDESVGTIGFGGNTTVLVWDAPTSETSFTTDHISVSSQTMNERTDIAPTDDIFGYYYQTADGHYKYIYTEGYNVTSTSDLPDALTRDGKIVIYEYNGDGGMYGDGHLSFAEGFRSGELYGYGFAGKTPDNARIVNSFQRMDMLRLTDCAVTLLGARDYNISEISATPYSIARVGEIQMVSLNVRGTDGNIVTSTSGNILAATTAKRSRNYLGLSNNIHYCGAIYSNVAFADDYRKADGSKDDGTPSYIQKKQYYIDTYKGESDDEFIKRNDGTAANMIGIASGYALKVQNIKTVASSEEIIYGPVVGVVEIALVNVRDDEGGGYVYAKNIHSRKAAGAKQYAPRKKAISTDAPEVDGAEDFLQTSGNFVFPHDASRGRYIVDDCFSHGYDAQESLAVKDDIHYWYVTGTHYYYNTTITGYTYNSSSEPYLKFNSDNHDALMNLVGTPLGSAVKLKNVTWRSAHTENYEGDIEMRNIDPNSDAYQKYQLVIGATSATTYDGLYDYSGVTPETDKGAYYVNVPFTSSTGSEVGTFVGTTEIDGANIVLQLIDKANNSGAQYYQEHMSEPCKVTIDLETDVSGVKYTYTIYLTINYVQGPDVTGAVKVVNCALPGEMIEINKGSIQIGADHSMPQCATVYRIGPRVKDENGEWRFKKDSNDKEIFYTYEVGYPYLKEKGDDNATSEMLADVIYDESNTTNPCIRIPAYYFMDGYGVQYCFKVLGLNELFLVPMDDDSKLEIHNYHRMEPRRSGGGIYEGEDALDLHIDLAAQRAANSEIPEPRIYIEDETDLLRFATFINEKKDEFSEVGTKNDFGANMQFVMQDNVTVGSDYVAPDNFKGTFHGDGHAIMGIANNASLLKAIDASANIHNLGLVSGRIVSASSSANNPSLHCCYEYGYNTVYRIDGTAFTGYAKEDWRYGKVAYDLNQYYLHKRYVDGTGSLENTQDYVEKYYENGDYLYSGYSFDNHYEGSEFIRNSFIPNYGYAATTHDTSHPIDESRAVVDEEGNVTYRPLMNENLIEGGKPKNDYFFFGQILNADTKNCVEGIANLTVPAAIAKDEESNAFRLYEDMKNRVYRAGGYYGSKNNNGFYYNSDAYVHDNGITAIDFYGYNGLNYTDATNIGGNISRAAGTGMDFYYPVSDYGMNDISLDNGVTRNLLLYARSASDLNGVLATFKYSDTYGETPATPESNIRAHVINQAVTPTTEFLHLVERTVDNKNSEGGDCFNNDFNCPIAFVVSNRAWYTRVPRYYAANKNDAWEGISLPFSVNRVEASFNGEISHFYGETDANAANATEANTTNVGHEYWLRGLTASTPAADSQPIKATFTRPGAELFTGGTLTGDYRYFNSHFADIYGDIYEDNNFSIYRAARDFSGYYFQQAYVPYIVSFPGATFKEFDLSGDFNQSLSLGEHGVWDADTDAHGFSFREVATKPQNVTFSWYGNNPKVSNLNIENANLIGVTDDSAVSTTAGVVTHRGAFSAQNDDDTYGIDDSGTSFSGYERDILPFRTYMTITGSSSPGKAFAKPESILIYEDTGIEELPQNDEDENDGLRIYAKNRKIYVESPAALSLSLYTATGQLVRIFNVVPGTNTYSGFANGIYIVGKKKLSIK